MLTVVLDGNPSMPGSWKISLAVLAICAIAARNYADDGWRTVGHQQSANDSSGNSAHRPRLLLIMPTQKVAVPGTVTVTSAPPENVAVTLVPIPPHNGWKSNNDADKPRTAYWRRAHSSASADVMGIESYDSQRSAKPAESAGKTHTAACDATGSTTYSCIGAGTSTYELTCPSGDTPSVVSSNVSRGLASYDSKRPDELPESAGENCTAACDTTGFVTYSSPAAGTSTYELTATSADTPSLISSDMFTGFASYDSNRTGEPAEASAEIRTADFNSAGLVTYSCSEAGTATYRLSCVSTDSPRKVLQIGHSASPARQNSTSDSEPDSTDGEGVSAIEATGNGLTASELISVKRNALVSKSHYLEQLRSLVCEDEQVPGSYLSDLNQLIAGGSKWLLAKDELIDLEPSAAEPTLMSGDYLSDLQRLVEGLPVAARQTHLVSGPQYDQGPYRIAYGQSGSATEYYEIPRLSEAECRALGNNNAGVDSLFIPLHEVTVTGHSTAPPILPADAPSDKLEPPPDFASRLVGADAPAYYYAQGYGVGCVPRNTHRFYNNPLYFEDPNLERCGISRGCLTTASSAVDFAWQTVLMPYRATVQHPSDCVAALPDCPTCHNFGSDAYASKWSWKAAAVQGAAVTGMFFVIP